MARARNIKPGFFTNELLAELPHAARLLFIGLWCLADREGRLEDRPIQIKMRLFAGDGVTSSDIDGYLTALHKKGFIYRYSDGRVGLIQVVEWKKHQNPHHREQPSTLTSPESLGLDPRCMAEMPRAFADNVGTKAPGFSLNDVCRVATNEVNEPQEAPGFTPMEGGVSRADSLIPSSLIPDSLQKHSPNSTSSHPRSTRKAKPVPERFEEFWKLYPRRVAKVDALRAFAKLSGDDVDLAIAAIPSHVRQWDAEGRDVSRIPYPATWLNRQAWTDELTPVRPPPQRPQQPSRQARQLQAIEDVINDPRYAATAQRQLASDRHRPGTAAPHNAELALDAGPGCPAWDDDGVD